MIWNILCSGGKIPLEILQCPSTDPIKINIITIFIASLRQCVLGCKILTMNDKFPIYKLPTDFVHFLILTTVSKKLFPWNTYIKCNKWRLRTNLCQELLKFLPHLSTSWFKELFLFYTVIIFSITITIWGFYEMLK